jgi:threonyl-tRNA synthetase
VQANLKNNKDEKKPQLASQLFLKDDMADQDWTWHEHALKPGFKRPVIVHRAVLGSVERFMAILIEHLAGKWPFWLSPRQVIVLPISDKAADYCESVYKYLHLKGFEASIDRSSGQINKKVRNAQLAQWNYILVAGEEEMATGCVDVRTRDNVRHGKMRIDKLVEHLETLNPVKPQLFDDFYRNAWNPADYKDVPLPEPKSESLDAQKEEGEQ